MQTQSQEPKRPAATKQPAVTQDTAAQYGGVAERTPRTIYQQNLEQEDIYGTLSTAGILTTPLLQLGSNNAPDWTSIIRAIRALLPALPTFSGKDYEDPNIFLQELERYFTQSATERTQWTHLAGKALGEPASKWFEVYKSLPFSWEEFKKLLLKRYASTSTLMKLRTQLYSRKQGEKEQTAVFLQQQYLLAQRLQPDDPEEETVAVLLELLRPSIRRCIRAASPRTFDDLFERALEAEADENDDPPKKEARKEETKLKPTTATEKIRAGPLCE